MSFLRVLRVPQPNSEGQRLELSTGNIRMKGSWHQSREHFHRGVFRAQTRAFRGVARRIGSYQPHKISGDQNLSHPEVLYLTKINLSPPEGFMRLRYPFVGRFRLAGAT